MSTTTEKIIRVFIVDDYSLVRLGLTYDLESQHRVELVGEAEDGEEAVHKIITAQPDLVLMDLGLPKLDGIEVTKQIKAYNSDIKVLILTSHENENEVIASLSAGANGYCLKDISSQRLMEAIIAVFEGSIWLDPAVAGIALKVFQKIKETLPQGDPVDYALTDREFEVLSHIVAGKSNAEIADHIFVSTHTVKTYVCNILEKLSVTDRLQAAVKAIRENIV